MNSFSAVHAATRRGLARQWWGRGIRPRRSGLRTKEKEKIMTTIFTMAALADKSVPELRALFQAQSRTLAASEPASDQRRAALSNLETIERALAARYACGR